MALKVLHLTTLVVLVNLIVASQVLLGSYGPTLKATGETQKLCDQVKSQVEKETGMNYEEFRAVEYQEQFVAGTNFLIKVQVGGNDYINLKVFKALPSSGGQLLLRGVQQHQTKDSPLQPFQ